MHAEEHIDAIGPLTIVLNLSARPSQIVLQSTGRALDFAWRETESGGQAQVVIERLKIHAILGIVA